MTDKLAVSEHEVGLYRVFALDLPASQITAFTTPDGDAYPLRDALSLAHLDPQHVQILDLKDLQALGVEAYLSEGLGLTKAKYASALPRIEAREGHIAVIASAAFQRPEIIVPKPPVAFIALLQEDAPKTAFVDLSTPSAEGTISVGSDPAPMPKAPMPVWAKVLITLITFALIYGVYALVTSGDTP